MRLTEKNEFGYILHIKPVDNSLGNEIAMVGETANKLGQLEDIEDKYNIKSVSELDKKLKALEIIGKKGLNTSELWIMELNNSWEKYTEVILEVYSGDEDLETNLKTQEEYDLLKEVLLDEKDE